VAGVYVIACQAHTVMGTVGVAVVGDPVNIERIDPSELPPRAKAILGKQSSGI
jgi:hypothetical protein